MVDGMPLLCSSIQSVGYGLQQQSAWGHNSCAGGANDMCGAESDVDTIPAMFGKDNARGSDCARQLPVSWAKIVGDAASLPTRAPNDPSAAPRVRNEVKDQRARSPGMPPSLSEKESVSSPVEKCGVAAEKSEANGDVAVHSGSVEDPGLEERVLLTESNLSSQGPGEASVASIAEENDVPVSDEGREEFEEKQSCGVAETSASGGVFSNIKTEISGGKVQSSNVNFDLSSATKCCDNVGLSGVPTMEFHSADKEGVPFVAPQVFVETPQPGCAESVGNFIAAQGVVLNKGIRDGERANQGAHKGLGDKPLLAGDNPKVALLEEESFDRQRSDKGPQPVGMAAPASWASVVAAHGNPILKKLGMRLNHRTSSTSTLEYVEPSAPGLVDIEDSLGDKKPGTQARGLVAQLDDPPRRPSTGQSDQSFRKPSWAEIAGNSGEINCPIQCSLRGLTSNGDRA
ncbi:hypothetical protein U1Q18_044918, partial [Sarracenia purpurea var. burkii]